MKKILFSLSLLCAHGLTTEALGNTGLINHCLINNPVNGGKKMEITIGSSRASGDMHLRFNSKKAGNASISILDEAGKIVLQQSNQVANSENIIPLKNVTKLGEGTYTVRLVLNNQSYTSGFLIWK